MIQRTYNKFVKSLKSNQISLLIFLGSFFIYTVFSGTRLFFSDEGIILDQFYNLIHGSLALEYAKINTAKGVLILVGNNIYGVFSYSLLILSIPLFYLLKLIDHIYGAHMFILQVWALTGGVIVYLALKMKNYRHAPMFGTISYFILISFNLYFFKLISFPKWGELLSIEFTNILIASFSVLVVYELFRHVFSQKIGIFAAFFVVFATPISFYAITLKHHSLTLLLTLIAFYSFYKYCEKNEKKFIYLAYISAGLCIWTRVLDGTVLLISLLIFDIIVFRRGLKHIISISIIILVSLLPFFGFNYMILGDPFSIVDNQPLADKEKVLIITKDMISLDDHFSNTKQIELLKNLGFNWTASIKGDWGEILWYVLFSKLINSFGIFLVSPFLIIALAFIFDRIRWRIKINTIDGFFILYILVLFTTYWLLYIFLKKNALMAILNDTPSALEYRYLLVLYVVLLYFALRVKKINELIHNNYKKLGLLYGIILITNLIYFIVKFPIPFVDIYYYGSSLTALFLILLFSAGLIDQKRKSIVSFKNNTLLFLIALALSEASMFLFFYYWVVSMTYISPGQNLSVLPIINNMIEWMYSIIY